MNSLPASSSSLPDHVALRRCARDLKYSLSVAGSSEPGITRQSISESLDEFCRHVNRHFDAEEREWASTGEVDWTSRARIDAWKREHDGLRARLDVVVTALHAAQGQGGAPSSETAAGIRGLLDELLRHELSEAGLLQSQVLGECPRPHWEG